MRGNATMEQSKNVLLVIVVVGLLLVNNVARCATLTAGSKVQLCKSGDGTWDRKVVWRDDGSIAGMPDGEAVDNDGRIYVSDTFRNRILVFTPEGQPWKVIESEQLDHPSDISVCEDNTLLITAVVRERGEAVQFLVSYDGEEWHFQRLEKVEPLGGRSELEKMILRERGLLVAPFGRDGLMYLTRTGLSGRDLQLVDKEGRRVKQVPSEFFDQKGRYYKYAKDEAARIELGECPFGIFNESGKLLGTFVARGARLLKFRGWVYVIEQSEGRQSLLRRYGEDGSVEHEIRLVGAEIIGTPLISPNSEHFLLETMGTDEIMMIMRCTYRED
jgi:hypothetical protein